MESARAADADDAGCGAVSWRVQGQLMAHDAGCGAVSWRAQWQLMLMMLGAGRFRGQRKGS